MLQDLTPATRLLQKRRQQFEADEQLEAAKATYAEQASRRGVHVPSMHQGAVPALLMCLSVFIVTFSLPSTPPAVRPVQEVVFRQREEALKRRDLELQDSLLRFTKFLQENDAKRAKASRRAAEEARLRAEKEAEIARLHAEAAECTAQREEMQAALAKISRWGREPAGQRPLVAEVDLLHGGRMPPIPCRLNSPAMRAPSPAQQSHDQPPTPPPPPPPSPRRHQAYLQSVAEAGEAFQEVDDILARHATLCAANADLRAQQAGCAAEAEAVRRRAGAQARARAAELLDLNNRLAALKKELEAVQAEAAALEAAQEYSLAAAAARALEAGQVARAAANVYRQCLSRSRVAHALDETSPLAHLEVAANFLGDLRAALAAGAGSSQGTAAAAAASG